MSAEDIHQLSTRGFARPVGFGSHPALIVVDFIEGFTNPDSPLGAEAGAEITCANRLIAVARGIGLPIFFSLIRYDDADLADAGIWLQKIDGLRTLGKDSRGWEVDSRLSLHASDSIIVKKFASCFFGTDLLSRLTYLRIDTLILAGCTTSGCIRATAVDGCQYGFRTIVASDAVSDRLATAHRQSLIDIDLKYGDVRTVDEIVRVLDPLSHTRVAF